MPIKNDIVTREISDTCKCEKTIPLDEHALLRALATMTRELHFELTKKEIEFVFSRADDTEDDYRIYDIKLIEHKAPAGYSEKANKT